MAEPCTIAGAECDLCAWPGGELIWHHVSCRVILHRHTAEMNDLAEPPASTAGGRWS